MVGYIIRRILAAVPLLFIISVIVFSIIHLTPGDPALYILGPDAPEEDLNRLREQLGLNLPIIQQFIHWFFDLLRGDLGTSIYENVPVTEAIMNRIQPTFSLMVLSIIIALLIALPLGILSAVKQGTAVDTAIMGIGLIGISTPTFLIGLFLMMIFGAQLGWLPAAGYQPISEGFIGHIRYLIMPAFTLGLLQSALIMRMTRASMLDVLNANFIKAAKSRGVNPLAIIIKHGFRNAFLPILTVIGMSVVTLFGGAVITEAIFNIPGIGQMTVNSVLRRDYSLIQGTILFVGVVYILINILIDVLYTIIDPRIEFKSENKFSVKRRWKNANASK
ncbi:ABC transporter permease [Niallia nealsonii]|uniref:Peptide ABC transporter n=1 Tax=Niallia nealsonii TaxID=115979 RepID=A0A2N0Z716_9BACI|nr:ABC transporter permease [Niallia nealsonii]PKG25283.1 peptide ABC transporter [Niallia nealsonii]